MRNDGEWLGGGGALARVATYLLRMKLEDRSMKKENSLP
jgi:hypothetical protein